MGKDRRSLLVSRGLKMDAAAQCHWHQIILLGDMVTHKGVNNLSGAIHNCTKMDIKPTTS